MATHLQRQRPGEAEDAELRGGVVALALVGPQGRGRRERQDHTGALRDHVPQARPSEQEL